MKLMRLLFLAAAAASTMVLTACGEKSEPGTALAARFMAAEAVSQMYEAERVWVKDEPVVNGDTANVTATFRDQTCILDLVKHSTANKYGWVMKSIRCGKSASK